MTTRRLFTAVLPPIEAIEELDKQVLRKRSLRGPRVRWTPTHQWHITLLFTPQVHEDLIDDYTAALENAALQVPSFELGMAGGGAFPRRDRARHLIALLDDPSNGLGQLASAQRDAARSLGIHFDPRPYRPHLTLGRLDRPAPLDERWAWLDALRTARWRVGSAALVHSPLGPKGAEHRVIQEYTLG